MLARGLGVLKLSITENGEVMVDGGLVQRHPRQRFHWDRYRRRLDVRDCLLCFSQLLLQFLDFLLVLFMSLLILRVDLRILRMCFFQLLDPLVLCFDFLA